MRNYTLSKELLAAQYNIRESLKALGHSYQLLKRGEKRFYKKVFKAASVMVKQLSGNELFFNASNNTFEVLFLQDASSVKSDLGIENIQKLDLKILFKDKEFLNYFTRVIVYHLMYVDMNIEKKTSLVVTSQVYRDLRKYCGDVRKVVLSYFLMKEANYTLSKVQNITSYVLKGSKVKTKESLSSKQIAVLEQILTGVKYEKEMNDANNNIDYNQNPKKMRFNLLKSAYHTIRIKYISLKNGKHSSHKSPIMHWRDAHWRIYKSGKKVWVNGCWINESNSIVRVAS